MPVAPSAQQSQTSQVNGHCSGGRPPRKEAAAKPMMVRLSPAERQELEIQSMAAGMKLSDYVRSRALGRKVIAQEDLAIYEMLKDVEQEMKRQGGSFTLAAKNNGVDLHDLTLRLKVHHAILLKIDQVLEQVSISATRRGKRV